MDTDPSFLYLFISFRHPHPLERYFQSFGAVASGSSSRSKNRGLITRRPLGECGVIISMSNIALCRCHSSVSDDYGSLATLVYYPPGIKFSLELKFHYFANGKVAKF